MRQRIFRNRCTWRLLCLEVCGVDAYQSDGLALDGILNPLSLRTDCKDASQISSSVAGAREVEKRLDVAAHGWLRQCGNPRRPEAVKRVFKLAACYGMEAGAPEDPLAGSPLPCRAEVVHDLRRRAHSGHTLQRGGRLDCSICRQLGQSRYPNSA